MKKNKGFEHFLRHVILRCVSFAQTDSHSALSGSWTVCQHFVHSGVQQYTESLNLVNWFVIDLYTYLL